jgi:predicted DNA-binding transcriptional regulator YafY
MFTEEEIEALVLGARAVRSWGDPALARAADDALAKIENVLPERLRHLVPESALFRQKVRMNYADRAGSATQRTVWPLGLFYWGTRWSLGGSCEPRQDFRNFRLDRVSCLELLSEHYPVAPGRTIGDLMRHYEKESARQPEDVPGSSE